MKTSLETLHSTNRFYFYPACCLFIGLALAGCRSETPTPTPPAANNDAFPVSIEIFTPDDARSETGDTTPTYEQSFDVTAGTSLEEVMRKIEQPEVMITGTGVTAFVQSIDQVETTSQRGWTFTIDDQFANEGIGSTELTGPHTVRWRFTTFEEAMSP